MGHLYPPMASSLRVLGPKPAEGLTIGHMSVLASGGCVGCVIHNCGDDVVAMMRLPFLENVPWAENCFMCRTQTTSHAPVKSVLSHTQ